MKPQPFKESNQNLGAGNNPNTQDMPVAISVNPEITEGQPIPFFISNWKLTPEEIKTILETGEIWVGLMGYQAQPLVIMAENPFKFHGYQALDLPQ